MDHFGIEKCGEVRFRQRIGVGRLGVAIMTSLCNGPALRRGAALVVLVGILTAGIVVPARSATSDLPTLDQIVSDVAHSVQLTAAPNPAALVPPLTSMTSADATLAPIRQGCYASSAATAPVPNNALSTCAYGDTAATRFLLLTGDSQAAMWLPAANEMGTRLHWKVVFLAMRECAPWNSPNAAHFVLYRNVTEDVCRTRNSAVATWATNNSPAAVLFVGRGYPKGYDIDRPANLGVLEAEMNDTVTSYAPSRAKLIVIGPIPRYDTATTPYRPTDCLDGATTFVHCQLSSTALLPRVEIQADTFEVNAGHLHYAKVYPLICSDTTCTTVVRDGANYHVVYFDGAHINQYFSTWVGQGFSQILSKLLPA